MEDNKKTLLFISDHAMSHSGVGIQSRFLIEGLVATGKYRILQLGTAIKHKSLETVYVNKDFIIKPINGFGDKNLIRSVLINDKPDCIVIIQDPRFFTYLFEIENEVRSICPIMWWHVWDNYPYPEFNEWMYESVDTINCHSYLTYEICSKKFEEKSNFIPHTIPDDYFYKLDKNLVKKEKLRILGEDKKDKFVCLWVNRNCLRKRPADVLLSWKIFSDEVGQENCHLIMHTNPTDKAGMNLLEVAKSLDLFDCVSFSTEILDFKMMNVLYNIADVTLNISFNEGFGLTTLESMYSGTPIVASKTGGLIRQVVDCNDGSSNGVALDIDVKTLEGNHEVLYIYEDYVSCENVSKGLLEIYRMNDVEKKDLSMKVSRYARKEFNHDQMVNSWDKSIEDTIDKFDDDKKSIGVVYL